MRATKRFERRITTPYFKVGTLRKISGNGSVLIESSAGIPFEYIRIKGVTTQELPNRAEAYFSEIENADSYVPAGVNGAYSLALPSEFVGKQLTYKLNKTGEHNGVLLFLADGENVLFSNLTPLCNSRGTTYTVSGNSFTHLIFTNVYTSDKESEEGVISVVRDGIIDFWKSYDLCITAEISPDFNTPILCAGDSGIRLSFNFDGSKRVMSIPKSLYYQNAFLTMLFSEYDELEIRGRERRVIYKEGTVKYLLTGNEPWSIQATAALAGNGIFAYYYVPTQFTEGYCQYLDFVPWMPSSVRKNIFSVIGLSAIAIKLERNEVSASYHKPALDEIITFLKEKNSAGASAIVIAKRRTKIEHDISNTAFAEAMLSNSPPYGSDGEILAVGQKLKAKLEVGYYSLNEGDNAILTVLCQNEAGEEISRAEYTLRQGSAYKLTAPEIEGYTPWEAELWGAIKEDKTIIIEYKETK